MTWNPFKLLWALWVLLLTISLLLLVTLPILVLPRLEWRRAAAGAFGRAIFLLGGLSVRTMGLERLPSETCIIVANHASYVDGQLLFSYLPPRFGFVIKKEASRLPIAGFMLKRLGHHFVERRNRHEGGGDARRILRSIEQGQAIAFFPKARSIPSPAWPASTAVHSPRQPAREFRSCRSQSAARAACLAKEGSCRAGAASKSRCSSRCRRGRAAEYRHATARYRARQDWSGSG